MANVRKTLRTGGAMNLATTFSLLMAGLLGCTPFAHALTLCYEDARNTLGNTSDRQAQNYHLVMQAAAKSGEQVKLLPLPWKRCLSQVAKGLVDGALDASYTEERAAFAAYPTTADGKPDPKRRIWAGGYSLYKLKTSAAGWDGQNFTHLTGPVGLQLGYSIGDDLKRLGVPVAEFSGDAEVMLKRLTAGQVPLVALLTDEGDALLEDPALSGVVEGIQPAFSQKPYFVIFHKRYYADHQKNVEGFWSHLATVRESQAFKQFVRAQLKK